MLERAYSSVRITEKMPFTEDNLREVIKEHLDEKGILPEMTSANNILTVTCPDDPFELINRIEMKLGNPRGGYKYLDGSLIIPL